VNEDAAHLYARTAIARLSVDDPTICALVNIVVFVGLQLSHQLHEVDPDTRVAQTFRDAETW